MTKEVSATACHLPAIKGDCLPGELTRPALDPAPSRLEQKRSNETHRHDPGR